MSKRALDVWGTTSINYLQWHADIRRFYERYQAVWPVSYPDGSSSTDKPKIPDLMRLAAEDRARGVAGVRPSIACRPEKAGDQAKARSDKRERIVGAWWDMSRVFPRLFHYWSFDASYAGLAVCRVFPDTSLPKNQRFPRYERLEPALCFPDPVFTQGPFCDSMVYSYMAKVRTLQKQYGVPIGRPDFAPQKDAAEARVIEYYDDEIVIKIAEYAYQNKKAHTVLMNATHPLERCPVVIGVRPTADTLYHGEFDSADGVLEFLNQYRTMQLDDAMRKVYSETIMDPEVNDDESGPDGRIYAEANQRYERVAHPNEPFSNLRLGEQLQSDARAATLYPPSSSGDPNESIISASGIGATQRGPLAAIASIQRDVLAPMLEAANEIAFRCDVKLGNVAKTVYGSSKTGETFREEYKPAEDIGDSYHNEVVYGANSGLDSINNNVLVLQQWAGGNGLISEQTAMEMLSSVQDPQREKKQKLYEQLEKVGMTGLIQAAAQGQLDSRTWALIVKAVQDDEMTLHEAVAQYMERAALAAPAAPPQGPSPASPGTAGAGEAQPAQAPLPELAGLLS